MKRILMTGARGQIGTDLSVALKEDESLQLLCTALKPAERSPTNGLEATDVRLDVTDRAAMRDLVERYEIDTVFHLASLLSARGEEDPDLAWKVNLGGLRNVLELAREFSLKVFWPSSIAVFGPDLEEGLAKQDSPLHPRTMYGVTKVAGEVLCNYYFERHGVDVRSVRYPGIISHSSLPGGGTTDYAVEIFHAAAITESYTCYLKPDTVLPMMYMPDAIRATIEVMTADPAEITVRTSYNLSGVSFSPARLAEAIKTRIPDFDCTYAPDFRQSIAESWPSSIDSASAERDWGWRHQFGLDEIVSDMLGHLDPEHSRLRSEI
jgi:nucleoside-diphosphate-sugar epimerase